MPDNRGARILTAAEAYQGVPYALPPDGITTLDCSLYVLVAYRDAGYPWPAGIRTAEQQRQACQLIPLSQVQAGDLLFFERTYNAGGTPGPDGKLATHVGISFGSGSGKMWDAHQTPSRDGVGITNIYTDYWQSHLLSLGGRFSPTVTTPPPIGEQGGYVVSGTGASGLRVRGAPSTSAPTLGTLPEGTGVSGDEYAWRKIKGGNLDGWAADEYLTPGAATEPAPGWQWFTAEQVADVLGAPLGNVQQYLPLIYAALAEFGIEDEPTTIGALATIGVEVPNFEPINEYRNADGSIPSYWHNYGGGAEYHGRGFIQLTHLSNYQYYGGELGVDLAGNPELALDPTISAKVLALYFRDRNIPAMAQAGDWASVRRAVNGGYNGYDEFLGYVQALSDLR